MDTSEQVRFNLIAYQLTLYDIQSVDVLPNMLILTFRATHLTGFNQKGKLNQWNYDVIKVDHLN